MLTHTKQTNVLGHAQRSYIPLGTPYLCTYNVATIYRMVSTLYTGCTWARCVTSLVCVALQLCLTYLQVSRGHICGPVRVTARNYIPIRYAHASQLGCGGGCTMRLTPKSWTGSDIERQMVRQMVEDAQYSNCLSLERRLKLARCFRKAVPVAFLCLWLLYGISCVYLEHVQSVICTSKEDREYWGSLGKNFV